MPNPYSLIIDGVDGGANLLDLPAPSAPETPYVKLDTLNLQMSGDGGGGSMSFTICQTKTPAAGPWWRSGAVNDCARVRFFDSRYSATVPLFLGFITSIDAEQTKSGLGSEAAISVSDADGWLDKTIIRRGAASAAGSTLSRYAADEFSIGDANATDQSVINALLAKVNTLVNDATTRLLLDTSIVSGSTRAIYTGTAQVVGKQVIKAGTLKSALDQVAEASSGKAGAAYRMFIDGSGRLNYGPVTAAPLFADAPYEIVTDPAAVDFNGSGGTATSKIYASNLSVTLDHGRAVRGLFVPAVNALAEYDKTSGGTRSSDYYFRSYGGTYPQNGAALTPARTGPIPMEVISAPKIQGGARATEIGQLARATMQTRGVPPRTVSFSIYGANQSYTSAPDLSYGYVQGYKYNGSAYSLVLGWQAGQYVKLTAPNLYLSPTFTVTTAARSTTTATITTSTAHGLSAGQSVTVALTSGPSGYAALNGTYLVTATPSATQIQYTTATSGTITSGAAAGTVQQQTILRIASLSMSFPDGAYIPMIEVQAEYRRRGFKGVKFITAGEV
jgi:hypothetical protein